jgi:hypothetical protein
VSSEVEKPVTSFRHYFVDEAGDGTIFNSKGRVIIGDEGCSKFFMLGLLNVNDFAKLSSELKTLHQELLADPYLKKVPSMQPEAKKTAITFHAKDDCQEVRREVFSLIIKHDVQFFALIRDKSVILQKINEHNLKSLSYRYHPNHLYDRCVSRLFRNQIHKEDGYTIHFAKRGNRDRTEALKKALEQARNNFRLKYGINTTSPIEVLPSTPLTSPCLQVVDYFLWALQRMYERGDDRYWDFISSKVSLVHDVDDTSNKAYGEYYVKKNKLTLERIKK